MHVFLNGKFVPKEEATVSVFDHGLLYGDGIFEGIRHYSCVFKLEEHLERLELSAKAILLDLPMSRSELADAVCETCRQNGLTDGYIRLLVTRGVGHLGLSPKGCETPSVIIIADKIQLYPKEYYEDGLKIITVPTRRINPAALPPMVKSLNYLNNILAKIEAQQAATWKLSCSTTRATLPSAPGTTSFWSTRGALSPPRPLRAPCEASRETWLSP